MNAQSVDIIQINARQGVSRYLTSKNRRNTPDKLEILKHCRYCNKHTFIKKQNNLIIYKLMNFWNKDKRNSSFVGKKRRDNWNQSLKTKTKSENKSSRVRKSLQYLLLLKKFDNVVDYKNLKLLSAFLTKYGKIRSRRKTRISVQQQKSISKSIRKARALGLIPFTCDVKNLINISNQLMRKARSNNNFIDKTFTIIADVLLRVFFRESAREKAFSYYLNGLSAQDEGEYAEALNNYYQALQIEEDLYDRSIILYNIGLNLFKKWRLLKSIEILLFFNFY